MRRERREWIARGPEALLRDIAQEMRAEARALLERVQPDVPVVILWKHPAIATRMRPKIEARRRCLIEGRGAAWQRDFDRDRHALRLRHTESLVDEAVRAVGTHQMARAKHTLRGPDREDAVVRDVDDAIAAEELKAAPLAIPSHEPLVEFLPNDHPHQRVRPVRESVLARLPDVELDLLRFAAKDRAELERNSIARLDGDAATAWLEARKLVAVDLGNGQVAAKGGGRGAGTSGSTADDDDVP